MRRLRRRAADMDDERVRFEENPGAGFLYDEELDKCWEEECGPLCFSQDLGRENIRVVNRRMGDGASLWKLSSHRNTMLIKLRWQ